MYKRQLLITGVILTVAGLAFKRPMLFLFGASPDTISYAERYITIYLLGLSLIHI